MPADERDPQFERALGQHLRRAASQSDCPDAEILAAYHERTLSPDEMAFWKQHMAACGVCQEFLALVEATESLAIQEQEEKNIYSAKVSAIPVVPLARAAAIPREEQPAQSSPVANKNAPVPAMKPPIPLRWAIPAGALAAAALLWISFHPARNLLHVASPAIEVAKNKVDSSEYPAPPAPRPQQNQPAQPSSRADVDKFSNVSPSVSAELKSARPAAPQTRSGVAGGAAYGGVAATLSAPEEKKLEAQAAAAAARDALRSAPMLEQDAKLAGKTAQTPAPPARVEPAPAPAASPAGAPVVETSTMKQRSKAAAKDSAATQNESAAVQTGSSLEVSTSNRNYTSISLPELAGLDRHVILAQGSEHAWRVGEAGKIEFTSNGGKSWKRQNSGVTVSLTSGSAPSREICWIAGKNGTLLLTTDGGKLWKKISTPIISDFGEVRAADAFRAHISDLSNATAYDTSDGGLTWSPAPLQK